jgi:tRNA(fMet)-specific endonuclease VapC
MRLALDTNRYTDFARGEASVVRVIQAATKILIPFVVLGELRAGFQSGTRAKENEAILTRVLQRPMVSVLYPDGDSTYHYAAIYSQLRRQGTPVPTNDLWIAALVIQHEAVLFSRDSHFKHIAQLARI